MTSLLFFLNKKLRTFPITLYLGLSPLIRCCAHDLPHSARRPRIGNKNLFCSMVGSHTVIGSGERSGVMGNTSDVSAGAVIGIWWESRRWFFNMYLRDSGHVNVHSVTTCKLRTMAVGVVPLELSNSVVWEIASDTTKYWVTTEKTK